MKIRNTLSSLGIGCGLSVALLSGCLPDSSPFTPATGRVTAQSQTNSTIPDEIIVRLQPGANPQDYARQNNLELKLTIGQQMYVFKGPQAQTLINLRDARTRWIEPNHRISLPRMETRAVPTPKTLNRNGLPNDPLLATQYGFFTTGTDKIWITQSGSPEVVVAVIDSGIDGSHPEFQGQWSPVGMSPKSLPAPVAMSMATAMAPM